MYHYERRGNKVVVLHLDPLDPEKLEGIVPLYQGPPAESTDVSSQPVWRPFTNPNRPIVVTTPPPSGKKKIVRKYRTVFL